MQNQYDGYFFRASEFEYIKTLASVADTERLGSDITLAQAINPSYFCYQTKAFSGSHTKIEDLSAEQSKEKWVTYNKVTGSGANITRTEVQAKDVKSDLSNINEIVVWGYSQPTEYEVKFHYPKSEQAPTEIKNSGLYTRSDYTITDTLKCYYNQLINPNEDNPAPAVFVPTGYEFDGWYLVDFSSNGGYVKVTDEAFFNCRITSNLELYAVFRETGKNAKASVSAMSNGVDVFTTGSADDNTQATKYRLNTLMAANGIENSSIEQVGVVYVKATKKSQHTYSDINAIKGTLETELAKTTPSSTVTYSGSEAAVSFYKYDKTQAQLTSKNRLQFVLTLGDTTADNKDVLAFTAYKSGEKIPVLTLQQQYSPFGADPAGLVVPNAALHLADVGHAHHQHAQAALADAAADGQGQLAIQQHAVEGQRAARLAAGQAQLAVQRFGVHADAHAGDLEGAAQHVVPEQDVAVERPVVVVGGAAVVGLAGSQPAADLHDQRGAVLPQERVLPVPGLGQVGVHVLQLLGGDAGHVPVQLDVDAGEFPAQAVGDVHHAVHDLLSGALQIVQVAVLAGDDLLPVPLVHVDGVDVVQLLVGTQGVHVGVDAAPGGDAQLRELGALPFGEGVYDLGLPLVHVLDREAHGALDAVQLVVEAGPGEHDHRSGHAQQGQLC